MSRTNENKTLIELYAVTSKKLDETCMPSDKLNSMTFTMIEAALLDISMSLAVIADKLTEKEETK